MTKKHLAIFGLALSALQMQAQSDPVLLKVNGNPVSKSEFEYVYNKNNNENSIEKKTLSEYKDLFVDFKIKVEEAKALGIDTTQQFIREFESYKNQLLAPYLLDTITEQTFAKSLFSRTKENIEVSHILLKFNKQQLLPADTLEVYNKAIALRNKLLGKKAVKFEDLALESSDDPSAKTTTPAGYMGWTTSGMFVAPFEDAMYGLKAGEISLPVRTSFGYHIIKVHNRRPDPGLINVAHIMLRYSAEKPSQHEVDSLATLAGRLVERINAGEDYAKICTDYSEDRYSAEKGGEIGFFGVNSRIPNDFKKAAFALTKVGDISVPVKTDFGLHIIKLIDKKDLPTWEESKQAQIEQLKRGDRRSVLAKYKEQALADKLDCVLNSTEYSALASRMNTTFPTDSLFLDEISRNDEPLFVIGEVPYSVKDFSGYISKNQRGISAQLSTEMLDDLHVSYLYENLQNRQKEVLVKNNADIRNLVKEYHDGILLFDVMNRSVWEKASTDTLGLEKFFAANKSKYVWDAPKYKGIIVMAKDAVALGKAKQVLKKNKKSADWITSLKTAFANDTLQSIKIERGLWGKGENVHVDYLIFNKKTGEAPAANEKHPLFIVEGKLIIAPEDYSDVKGLVVSDYQDKLEKDWMESLRTKYTVEVNNEILNTVK